MAAANGVSIHHGNHRLRQTADLHLHIKHIQPRHAIGAHISATTFHIHIAPATKSLVAGTGKNHHANAARFAAESKSLTHFGGGTRGESIAIARTIDGDFGNAIVFFKQDFLKIETLDFFPDSHNLKEV